MVRNVEEPGLATSLVDLPRDVRSDEIDHRDFLCGDGRGVDDQISAVLKQFPADAANRPAG